MIVGLENVQESTVLSFPNQSRTYDPAADRVRFWGHDGALEITFFLQLTALFRLYPQTSNTEAEVLAAFDEGWSLGVCQDFRVRAGFVMRA